jgi:hypothetical protein
MTQMTHSTRAKERFLEALRQDPTVSLACEIAGIARKTVYRWREQSETFAEQWDEAVERGKDVARSSIYKRGILGWDEPIVSMGQIVYAMEPALDDAGKPIYERGKPLMRTVKPLTTHKWSDSLALLYAKANLPEYKEKQHIDLYQHMAEQAEQDKQSLLADLDAAIANDHKKPEPEKGL